MVIWLVFLIVWLFVILVIRLLISIRMLLLINKPLGLSSFDIIRILRRTKGIRKIGHAGTLDPLATGLMILATDQDTKKLTQLTGLDKTYECEVEFGKRSTSGDADGVITQGVLRDVSHDEFEKTLKNFVGEIEQRPPQTSAIKIGGKRAYALAREGIKVEMPTRIVRVDSIEILEWAWPRLRLRIACGKGTYIRSIAIDLGEAFGTGAYLTGLTRTAIGEFLLENAEELPEEEVAKFTGRFGGSNKL